MWKSRKKLSARETKSMAKNMERRRAKPSVGEIKSILVAAPLDGVDLKRERDIGAKRTRALLKALEID
jgi:hypothetical protein